MYGGGSWSSPALEGSWTLDPTRDICRMTRSAWLHHKVTFSWSRSQPSVNQQRRRPPSLGPGSKKGHAGVEVHGISGFRPPGSCCRPSSSSGGSESLADVSPRERRPPRRDYISHLPLGSLLSVWSRCNQTPAANTFDLKSNLMA